MPVTTVNIAKLKIKILRVGDRLLSQLETGVVDQTTIYGYDESRIESEQGSVIWQGTMEVRQIKNEPVTTLIPIRTLLQNAKPGAYVIMAADAAKPDTSEGEDDPLQFRTGTTLPSSGSSIPISASPASAAIAGSRCSRARSPRPSRCRACA